MSTILRLELSESLKERLNLDKDLKWTAEFDTIEEKSRFLKLHTTKE